MSGPEKKTLKYPRAWKNKLSGQLLRVMPWWEVVKDGEIQEVDELGQLASESTGTPCKFGTLAQIGFLLENEHGVWFGVGIKASEGFQDEGAWEKSIHGEGSHPKDGGGDAKLPFCGAV